MAWRRAQRRKMSMGSCWRWVTGAGEEVDRDEDPAVATDLPGGREPGHGAVVSVEVEVDEQEEVVDCLPR